MSTDNGKKKPQGFAAFTPEKRLAAQQKGGSARVPKGAAVLDPEVRSKRASRAAVIRWQKVKEARLKAESIAREGNSQTSQSTEL